MLKKSKKVTENPIYFYGFMQTEIDFELGDRSKNTYSRMFYRVSRNYRVNYLCTDDSVTYRRYRFDSSMTVSIYQTRSIEQEKWSLYLLFDRLYWKFCLMQ
jgi:IS1 family transposase